MGIVIRDALAAVPGPDGIEISRHTIYVAGDLIAGIDELPAGFSGDEVVEGTWSNAEEVPEDEAEE